MKIGLRSATGSDHPHLAVMNAQLIKDEGSRKPMSLDDLAARFQHWSAESWQVMIIEAREETVGYSVFNIQPDEYKPQGRVVYVRQFYIAPEHRGRGLGTQALDCLVDKVFPKGARLEADVLETNPSGAQFWIRAGFRPYYTRLVRVPDTSNQDTPRRSDSR